MTNIITYLFTFLPSILSFADFALIVAGGGCIALTALLMRVILGRR